MRRNKGLLITMIIIIVLLILAVVGFVLWRFVFSNQSNNNENTIQNQNVNPPSNTSNPIQVGDYVDYVPDNASNYLLTEKTTGSIDNNEAGIEQEELRWRILSINDDGTVDIISEEPISTEVYFKGVSGFNNAVYLINDLCEKQYSNEELGATARSLSLVDLENNMTDTGIEARDLYVANEVAYGNKKIYTEDNAYVPAIYVEYELDIANESLAHYEQPTENTFAKPSTVTFIQTFYKLENLTGNYFESEDYYNLIFNTVNGSWLATRCIDCSSDTAMFGLFTIGDNEISGSVICASNGRSGSSQNYIRPIVTLGEDIEISEEQTGTADNPRALTKLDLSDDMEGEEEITNEEGYVDDISDLQGNANDIAVRTFNSNFTPYEGTEQSASQIRSLISAVRSSNANSEHQVEIQGISTSDIEANGSYTVELEYDEENYICVITITEE